MRKIIYLPVEIQDREFDAKLLLSAYLLSCSSSKIAICIGYDKTITEHINRFSCPSLLLDKSCSNIMYQARLRPVYSNGGKVFVSDEEGINNLPNNKTGLLARFDPRVSPIITRYFTWGNVDKSLAIEARIKPQNITASGNPRLDLLSSEGRNFYSSFSNSLKTIFGDFVLVSDNFAIEHFDENYIYPKRPHMSTIDYQNLLAHREKSKANRAKSRSKLAEIILKLSLQFPSLNFVIRPHPISDPLYWHTQFRRSRNVFIHYQGPIEPWLFAAKGLLSAGCTTALQAAYAKVPVYELSTFLDSQPSFASNVGYSIKSYQSLCSALSSTDHSDCILKSHEYAFNLFSSEKSPSLLISKYISDESNSVQAINDKSFNAFKLLFSTLGQHIHPVEPKWRLSGIPLSSLTKSFQSLCHSYKISLPSVKVTKVAAGVFILEN